MFTKIVLPILAVAGVAFAVFTVVKARETPPASAPFVVPPTRPNVVHSIAGSGIVEARRENIPIGVNVPGVVVELFVKKGDFVRQGAPLFRVDDRDTKAMLRVRQADFASAKAQWHKLKMAPRPEDVPPAEAAVAEAKARLDDTEAAMARSEKLFGRQMVPASDWDKDRYAYLAAKATYAKNIANLDLLKKGTWKEDLDVAQAAVDLAQAQVDSININLERLTARAPTDGEILQLNVRLGQFAAMQWKEPMIVLGDVNRLHVRADIDESDLPWFDKDAPAVATLKGRPQVRFPLSIVYIEPYVVPKQSLTGSNSERVDTRVLQVIYALPDEREVSLHVGQQMDVYMKAGNEPKGIELNPATKVALPFEEEATPPVEQGTKSLKPKHGA